MGWMVFGSIEVRIKKRGRYKRERGKTVVIESLEELSFFFIFIIGDCRLQDCERSTKLVSTSDRI